VTSSGGFTRVDVTNNDDRNERKNGGGKKDEGEAVGLDWLDRDETKDDKKVEEKEVKEEGDVKEEKDEL